MIKVTKEGTQWVARFPWSIAAKDAVKAAGFRFDGTRKLWWTNDPVVAARLDPNAAAVANAAIEASRAVSAEVTIPAPEGLAYLGYQKAGIAYCLEKFGDPFPKPYNRVEEKGGLNAQGSVQENPRTHRQGDRELSSGTYTGGPSQGQRHEQTKRPRPGVAQGGSNSIGMGSSQNQTSSRGVLLADEQGLGKTIEAIGVINADPNINNVLVVCPASLKTNWARELAKWLVIPRSIAIAEGDNFPNTDIVIVNYDLLTRLRPTIDARNWDLLIADEAHRAKNPKAQRTQALLGHRKSGNPGVIARRKLLLTGTPIVNRPVELWPLIEALDPNGMGASFFTFAKRYTDAAHNGYGWDFTGAANLPELQQRMRAKFMVRRLKSEVLTELPAKRRQVIVVPPNGAAATVAAEQQLFQHHREVMERVEKAAAEAKARGDKDGYTAAIKSLHAANRIAFEKMSKARHATAVAKIPALIEHVTELLEAEDKVVVFIHHHDVAHALAEAFPDAAVVTGETKISDRTLEVDRFQTDPHCRVFIGSLAAAGIGLTLTAAQLVVFGEEDWVPGNINQAEDRLHRIGQHGSVLVQHLVFDDSVDAYMAQVNVAKQDVFDRSLDERGLPIVGAVAATTEELPLFRPPSTGNGKTIVDDLEVPF